MVCVTESKRNLSFGTHLLIEIQAQSEPVWALSALHPDYFNSDPISIGHRLLSSGEIVVYFADLESPIGSCLGLSFSISITAYVVTFLSPHLCLIRTAAAISHVVVGACDFIVKD